MPTWAIVLLASIVVIFLYMHFKKPVVVVAKPGAPGGAALVQAAEQIPVYGAAVKAVATVGKPVNHALDKVNTTITAGLQHIPIAGKYLAMPNQAVGSGIKKLNSWLGLD